MHINLGSGWCGGSTLFKEGTGWVNIDKDYEAGKEQWMNAEYLKFDITLTWSIPREVADCIFASHIFEHIQYTSLLKVIEECYRVLKFGAPIRVICPDPRKFYRNWQAQNKQFILDCYTQENWDRFKYEECLNIGFTDMFFGDHYDHAICTAIEVVEIMMIRVGFKKVNELSYANTEFPQFFGTLENTIDNRPAMSWYLEAVK